MQDVMKDETQEVAIKPTHPHKAHLDVSVQNITAPKPFDVL